METFGPNTDAVNGVIERASQLTAAEAEQLAAAWEDARHVSWDAARHAVDERHAAWADVWEAVWEAGLDFESSAAWNAAWNAAGAPAGYAAQATVVRDLISDETYAIYAGPWEAVVGPIFPSNDDTPAQH